MIPIDLFLNALCPNGQFCLWNNLELYEYLKSQPECGKLYHIEQTTAAKGPFVLWYPIQKWYEELQRQEYINKLVAKHETSKTSNARESLEKRIREAQEKGEVETVETLRMILETL